MNFFNKTCLFIGALLFAALLVLSLIPSPFMQLARAGLGLEIVLIIVSDGFNDLSFQNVKKHRHLFGLVAVALLFFGLAALHVMHLGVALFCVGLWQCAQFAMSKRRAACFEAVLTDAQVREFQHILSGIKEYAEMFPRLHDLLPRLMEIGKDYPTLLKDVNELRRRSVRGFGASGEIRWIGNVPFVSDGCAESLTSVFVLTAAKEGKIEGLVRDKSAQERILGKAAAILGTEVRAAMTTTEIPVPTVYVPQIVELVWKYGQARQYATVFPLGAGTVKLPRLKVGEDNFGYFGAGAAGMSQSITEKKVTAELVTFTANKAGGLIRIPTELEEDTFIPIGQFLARYIARQFARVEDDTMFNGDGTATYASQTGITGYCVANPTYQLQLAAGKTKPSDATLADFRNLRAKVSAAVLAGGYDAAYYLSASWEPFLRGFNQYPNFIVFDNNAGKPTFDGWPVRWIGVAQPYGTAAAPSKAIAFFGALQFWYLGERGTPRVETSRDVFFATDEFAMRALERIDVEAMAVDAMATMQTAAA